MKELASVSRNVSIKAVKRVVPLDDELAKDLGEFDSLDALRARVREDLEHEAMHAAERQLRQDLLKQLAARVPFSVPATLVDREIDRRLEDFARRLMDQRIDPRQANIDWNAFREGQRAPPPKRRLAIVLDEIARRDVSVTDEDLTELLRYADQTDTQP
jgi:trigger factor